jgi:hypothetical protein
MQQINSSKSNKTLWFCPVDIGDKAKSGLLKNWLQTIDTQGFAGFTALALLKKQ